MANFDNMSQLSGEHYQVTLGHQRMAARRVESFRNQNGKISRIRRSAISKSFNPASPFDGQSLAGSGALVFEGELLGR